MAVSEYAIVPLALTKVEWPVYIKVLQDLGLDSPTRELDQTGLIKTSDPSAYLAALDFGSEPLELLREGRANCFEHYHVSFIAQIDELAITQIASFTQLKLHSKYIRRDTYVCILTGNIREWVSACLLPGPYELRYLMNRVIVAFERASFREIFNSYQKINLSDGTFKLSKN